MSSTRTSHATSRPGNSVGRDGARAATRSSDTVTPLPFAGFRPIQANFIYTPNQFFDVLLPHHSRGCVRLVGYLLRRTLGWLGKDGKPIEQRISVTYREMIDEAGVSRGGIRKAIDEAISARYVRCTQQGRSKSAGQDAVTARYELRWDASGDYGDTPAGFRGFFTGVGRRTPVPEDYFDAVLRREPLAVARVVGVVLRETVGYQNQFGGRKSSAQLSYSDLQRRTRLADRKTLAVAVQTATGVGYIERLSEGVFDPDAGRASTAATYGPRWIGTETQPTSPDGRPAKSVQNPRRPAKPRRSKNPAGDGSSRAVQNPDRQRSSRPTGVGSRIPRDHKEERQTKDTSKHTASIATPESATTPPEQAAAAGLLKGLGYDEAAVRRLLSAAPPEVIFRQASWLGRRNADRNRLGLLRRAILEDWTEPGARCDEDADDFAKSSSNRSAAEQLGLAFYTARDGGESAAEPGPTDVRVAARLLKQLPVDLDAAEAGRRLGEMARREIDTTRRPTVSVAVRLLGESLLRQLRRPVTKNAVPGTAARGAYRQHLLEIERGLRSSTDWPDFERWRDQARRRHEALPEPERSKQLAAWASDDRRLRDLAAFFDEVVPNFEAWAEEAASRGDH